MPCEEDLDNINNLTFKQLIQSFGIYPVQSWEQVLPKEVSPVAIDLLKKFLIFNPDKRITIDEALNHPFLAILNSGQQEPTTQPVDPIEFEFENYSLTIEQMKDCIYEEILLYHFPEIQQKYEENKKNKVSSILHILNNDNAKLNESDSDEANVEL
eukprot:TRINITY_DN8920_c0_g4_i1.p2 TRINITY_DN8920_c0_g4~~TRINITY_DN8920_c0_g4_i1.p2  ORF type:complete len:156 (+),score=26.19 TRINITY_DN8920_c0_g4_i1:367-834(+)